MNPEFLMTPLPTFYIRNPNLIYADLYSLIAHLKKESSHKTLPPISWASWLLIIFVIFDLVFR